jgi:membrane-bound lytic murein transglycosylase D
MTTPKDMDFDLHLPKGTAERFETAVAAIPEEMRVYWRYHRVESGETLSEIASRYHTTATAIAEANNLEGAALKTDSKLIIPVSPAKPASRPAALSYSKHPVHYTVRKGDTVLSVADDFGVPAEKVRQWNRLNGNALHAGRSLTIFKSTGGAVVEATAETTGRRPRVSAAGYKPGHGAHASAKSAGKGKGKGNAEGAAHSHPEKKTNPTPPAKKASAKSRKHPRRD